jgi:hypothetical protein
MPVLIDHIDKIARAKKRDVLMLRFTHENYGEELSDYDNNATRISVLAWLSQNGIEYCSCGEVANENSMLAYQGQIYVDVPYDTNEPLYQKLASYLENEDGTMKIKDVGFYLISLADAMKNAHHDEPGFWEDWAAHF